MHARRSADRAPHIGVEPGEILMTGRVIATWCVLLGVAVVNGGFREAWLVPSLGAAPAHVISTVMLCGLIAMTAWLALPAIGIVSSRQAWAAGAAWALLTLAFEFVGGHYLFGTPWTVLLADWNVVEGRIWPMVIVTTLGAPLMALRLRARAITGRA
jgi:hypothetical protein